MVPRLSNIVNSWLGEIIDLLMALARFKTVVGEEQQAQEWLAGRIADFGFEPKLVPILEGVISDPDYTPVPHHRGYDGRTNLMFVVPGTGGGRSIILNSHIDVVPGPDELFEPYSNQGIIYGRGVCDAKGQLATILLALLALRDAGVRLKGDVIVQSVIEEEVGGNGTLSFILDGVHADGVIVMEPSGLNILPANRGAVWFRLEIDGKPTHMGRWKDGINAILEMVEVIRLLKEYETRLLADWNGDPLFPDPSDSIVVNIGTICGGDWPSMVPGKCVVEGGIGFLPNKRIADVQREVAAIINEKGSEWVKKHHKLEFNQLRNEAYRLSPDHPLVQTLYASALSVGSNSKITGFTASCDARLFYHRGHMPTVVFGVGDFSHAHSLEEQISIAEIEMAALILAEFLIQWCGTEVKS
jgi:acetylornithine deacetylase